MCGRYDFHEEPAKVADQIGARSLVRDWKAQYNITPGRDVLLARHNGETRALVESWWGFRPRWAAERAPAPINARAETVARSPYFRDAFRRHRCLIPANGWYEWRRLASGKQPYYITHADGELLMFAGVWTPAEQDMNTRCAIITEPARGVVDEIHNRMPLVLDPECWQAWLDPKLTDRDAVREATRHLPAEAIKAWPVSRRVNRPSEDNPALLEPVPEPEEG